MNVFGAVIVLPLLVLMLLLLGCCCRWIWPVQDEVEGCFIFFSALSREAAVQCALGLQLMSALVNGL